MLDKNTNIWHFQTTVEYIFSNYVHCDMQFLDVKKAHCLGFYTVVALLFRFVFI